MTLVSTLALILTAFSTGFDAKSMLAEAREFQAKQLATARAAGTVEAGREAMATVTAKVKDMVNGIDPNTIAAQEGRDFSQLFAMGRMYKEALTSAEKYVPIATGDEKFTVHLAAAQYAGQIKNSDKVVEHLLAAEVTKSQQALSLASTSANFYAPMIAGLKGPDDGLQLIDQVESKLKNETALPQADQDTIHVTLSGGRVEILRDAHRDKEALAIIDSILPGLDPKAGRMLKAAKIQMTMVGTPVVPLTIERGYGGFNSLESAKGKVVVIDFFAHWCGPCKAAFPALKQMYADLAPKGLEIVGVTRYYGYIGSEKELTPDVEFAKMEAFKSEQGMTWPIVFGQNKNFENYGITGIPHVVVVDRKGVVREIKIGYSPEGMKEFRTKIEKLLAEK